MSGVGAVVVLASSAYLWLLYDTVEEQSAKAQTLQANLIQQEVSSLLNGIERHLQAIAATPWNAGGLTREDRAIEFRRVLSVLPAVLEMQLVDTQSSIRLGVARTRVDQFEGRFADADLIERARKSKTAAYSSVLLAPDSPQRFLLVAVSDKGASADQVSVARVSLVAVADQLARIAGQLQGTAYLVASDGQMVAHSDRLKSLSAMDAITSELVKASKAQPRVLPHDDSIAKRDIERDAIAYVASWLPIMGPQWTLFFEQPTRVVRAPLYEAMRVAALMVALGLLAAALTSVVLARRFAQPVLSLVDSSKRFGAGQLEHRVEPLKGHPEFAKLVESFNGMASEIQALTHGLEERVKEKTAELKIEHEAREEKGREVARLEERSRIMRDLHDTVGGHLVAMLGLTKLGDAGQKKMADVIQDALIDYRVAIDALSVHQQNITTVIANLKFRLTPRIEASGLQARWQIDTMPNNLELSQECMFHAQRIVSEAITNAVKHARVASMIETSLAWNAETREVLLRVRDDGKPRANSEQAESKGRGTENMKTRAQQIGARLTILPGTLDKGTEVLLVIPVKVD